MLRRVADALREFHAENGRYPEMDDTARMLRVLSSSLPHVDAWGHRLAYLSLGGGSRYALASPGADGRFDRGLEDYARGARPRSGHRGDLVLVNGNEVEHGD